MALPNPGAFHNAVSITATMVLAPLTIQAPGVGQVESADNAIAADSIHRWEVNTALAWVNKLGLAAVTSACLRIA